MESLHPLSKMYIFAFVFIFLLEMYPVHGADTTSLIPRQECFQEVQQNCDEDFIDAYPNLSKSTSGLVKATTWFLLFTSKNTEKPELLHKCGGKLPPNSNFNPKNRLIVLINPFTQAYCDVAVMREWKSQLLQKADVNIMVIDYGWGNHLDYGQAVKNMKIAAKQSTIVLKNIQDETGISSKQIHLIGHSLGAQAAGRIGYLWFRKTKSLFRRITALDAAGPAFAESVSLSGRLDKTDAEFVDVMHTDAGDCLPHNGINYDAGHVDFYVNDGTHQPSCFKYGFISLLKEDFIYGLATLLVPTGCSHSQSTQYFKVSINPGDCQFVGVECTSYDDFKNGRCRKCGSDGSKCAIMGYDIENYYNQTDDHHRYFVSTSLECPYCDNSNIDLEGFAETYKSACKT